MIEMIGMEMIGMMMTVIAFMVMVVEDTAEKVLRSKVSSAYTRIVGTSRIDLVNTKQTEGLPKKAYNQKWALIVVTGKRTKVVDTFPAKYTGIAALRVLEAEMITKNDE